VTCPVTTRIHDGGMAIDSHENTTPLEPGMLLKCSKCGQWHTVHDGRRADQPPESGEMLYWTCRGRVFSAGEAGSVSPRPVKRRTSST
jgi:hypothetical protein